MFVYNRPEHTCRVLESLTINTLASECILHVFADGPKVGSSKKDLQRVTDVRDIVSHIDGFKEVVIHSSKTNKGCARSVREGITEIIQQYGQAIIVEDDIVPVPEFLSFLNQTLDVYKNDKRIWAIGSYGLNIQLPEKYLNKHDLYIVHRSCSSGWATWADRWMNVDWEVCDANEFFSNQRAMRRFDRGGEGMSQMLKDQLDGKIDAWDIVWDYHIYKRNGYCIRPIKSFCTNIGFDGSGTHCVKNEPLPPAPLFNPTSDTLRLEPHIKPNREVQRIFYNYWSDTPKLPWKTSVKRSIKKLLRQWGVMKKTQA